MNNEPTYDPEDDMTQDCEYCGAPEGALHGQECAARIGYDRMNATGVLRRQQSMSEQRAAIRDHGSMFERVWEQGGAIHREPIPPEQVFIDPAVTDNKLTIKDNGAARFYAADEPMVITFHGGPDGEAARLWFDRETLRWEFRGDLSQAAQLLFDEVMSKLGGEVHKAVQARVQPEADEEADRDHRARKRAECRAAIYGRDGA